LMQPTFTSVQPGSERWYGTEETALVTGGKIMITMNDFERLRPRTVLNEHEILIKSLECTKPLRFAVAASSTELEAVYRLRY
jgi:hypothetical protein